jgi:hypothetical protein
MSQFVRKGSAFGGTVSEVALVSSDAFEYGPVGQLLTAVRDSAGHLKLIAWAVSQDGTQISRIGQVSGGAADQLAITVARSQPVVILRDATQSLKLTTFSPTLVPEGNAGAGPAQGFAITCFPPKNGLFSVLLSAFCDNSGRLKLVAWTMDDTSGALTRRGEATAGPVSQVTLVQSSFNPFRAVVAARSAAGNLELSEWHVSDDGLEIDLLGTAEAGAVSEVATVSNGDAIITSFRNGQGHLELIAWQANNGSFTRRGSITAGTVSVVASVWSEFSDKSGCITTAVRDSGGDLKLFDWLFQRSSFYLSSPNFFTRGADASAGKISGVSAVLAWGRGHPNEDIVVTAVIDSGSDLELIAWQRT